jgi:hypothetical protein
MIIRYGEYTLYNGIEMAIVEYYGHGLSQDIDENHRIISYPLELGYLDGFKLDIDNKVYRKDVLLNEINNAYSIVTKAIFNGYTFIVDSGYKENNVILRLDSDSDFKKLGYIEYFVGDEKKMNEIELYKTRFFKVHNGFIITTEIDQISKLWEERSKSKLDLPMPKEIELIKEIKKSKNI